jgi:tetratricopeptide (TPR) repeat protein
LPALGALVTRFVEYMLNCRKKRMRELLDKAALHLKKREFQEAREIYRKVLQEDADNISALSNISSASLALQKYDEAIMHLNRALKLQPANAHLYSERGVANFLNNNISAAMADLNHAQQLEPQNPYRYSSRAYVRDKAGDTKGAIVDYEKAISLDPADAIAHNNLGLLLEKSGYKTEAKQRFETADRLEGRTPERMSSTPKTRKDSGKIPAPELPEKPALNFKHYNQVLRSVLTTRTGFKEFIDFLRGKK